MTLKKFFLVGVKWVGNYARSLFNLGNEMPKKTKENIKKAMKHPDKLGAGAKKRKKLHGKDKVETVMKEYKRGTLHSGSGKKVTKRSQAIAIAMHESGLSKKKRKK